MCSKQILRVDELTEEDGQSRYIVVSSEELLTLEQLQDLADKFQNSVSAYSGAKIGKENLNRIVKAHKPKN